MGISLQLIFEGKAFKIYDLLENNKSHFKEVSFRLNQGIKASVDKTNRMDSRKWSPKK